MKRSGIARGSSELKRTPISRGLSRLARSPFVARPAKRTSAETVARTLVRTRSAGVCERCGRATAVEYCHRKGRAQGGEWCPSNAWDGCRSCHSACHLSPALAYEQGWHVRSTQNPAVVPMWVAGQGLVYLTTAGTYRPVRPERSTA